MAYLTFNNKADAQTRSREAWEAHLGRKKRPEDTTEFLWPVVEHEDGKATLVVDEASEHLLTTQESASMAFEPPASLALDPPPPLEEM